MDVRWLTAFIDRPEHSFAAATDFWSAATGSTLSAARGSTGEFATLLPADGDAYLRVQRTLAGHGGSHLDVHVDDVDRGTEHAVGVGATVDARFDGGVVLRSPAGLTFCIVGHRGETTRPSPRRQPDDTEVLVDQICLDIPTADYVREGAFWSDLLDWRHEQSSIRAEFGYLVRPDAMPLRILIQEIGAGPPGAHLDLACTDVGAAVTHHETLGATVGTRFDYWTVMADPAGIAYCLTSRDPATGTVPTEH